ncbi:MAG TPA: hypothetical protein EYP35_00945 [Desulfobacterales bacterium]|nr:hypothetical protein [Desulfobacterales bacterium]HIP40438.1 hypothetical protein [Desulfocapsa sulfexigens]
MKMGMKAAAIVSVLALALMSGTAMAQNETASHHQTSEKKMQGKDQAMGMKGGGMMQGQGMGMMDGKDMMMQGGMGCMKMMGQSMGMMGGGMMRHMSADNQQKFMDATKEMRKEMHMMRFEHMDAMRNPETSLEDLAAMEQKMLDTRKEMMKKAKAFQDQKQ